MAKKANMKHHKRKATGNHYLMTTFKWVGVIFTLFVLVVISAGVIFTFTFNPDQYKSVLEKRFYQMTGRSLKISGQLKLSYFPWLGVKVDHIDLGNPPGTWSKSFIQLKQADVRVKLLPLFRGQFIADTIVFDGLTVNFIQSKSGQENWSTWMKQDTQSSTQTTTVSTQSTTVKTNNRASTQNPQWQINIPGIEVNHATVTWTNEQTQKNMTFNDVQFKTRGMAFGESFPLALKFTFNHDGKPAQGTVDARLYVNLDRSLQKLTVSSFRVDGTWKNDKTTEPVIVRVESGFDVDLSKKLIQLKKLDISSALFSISQGIGQWQYQITGTPSDAADWLRKIDLTGQLQVDKLNYKQLSAQQIVAKMTAKSGQFSLTSLTANLFNGRMDVSATVDMTSDVPRYTINESLQNMQAGSLLAFVGEQFSHVEKGLSVAGFLKHLLNTNWEKAQDAVVGTATLDAKLSTQGKNAEAMRNALNGTIDFMFKDGAVKGVDFAYYIQLGEALYKQQVPPQEPAAAQTDFGSLKVGFNIQNGVAETDNLLLQSPALQVTGQGSVNLNNQALNVSLMAVPMKSKEVNGQQVQLPRRFIVPLKLTGTLDKPMLQPDLAALLRLQTEERVEKYKEQVTDQIKKGLQKLFD